MKYMHSPTDATRQKLLSVSVQIKVLTPPCTVYIHISNMLTTTVMAKGMPNGPKTMD